MNISEKDKKILIALGILCFLVLAYYMFYSPYMKKINTLNKEVSSLQNKLNTLKVKQNSKEKTDAEFKTIQYQLQNYNTLIPPNIVQEQIIKQLSQLESKSGATLADFSYSSVTSFNTQTSSSNTKANKNTAKGNQSDSQGSITDGTFVKQEVKCSLNGTYEQVKTLLDEVINSPQLIRLNDLSLKNTMDGKVTGNIGFVFYGLYDSTAKASDWDFSTAAGRDNIFSAFSGYTQSNSQKTQQKENLQGKNTAENKNYDFILVVGPETADLPTVIMGKGNDKAGLSYVYADSNKTEDAEMELIEKDGRYYCRYKTQMYSFPKDYSQMAEISPENEKINLQIISSQRKTDGDLSGVSLKVINSTSLPINIKIDNDDPKSPRVKINTVEGKVIVE